MESGPVVDGVAVAVADQVRELLSSAPISEEYRLVLARALSLSGNILSDMPNARWARTVWACCTAAGGDPELAVPTAASVEIFMVALDILDDEEDGEETPLRTQIGPARALNVSTGLLFLGQVGLLGLVGNTAAADILLTGGLQACSGQDADLDSGTLRPRTLEESLSVTAGKSASLTSAACRLGAHCAGADSTTQDLYARFGWYLGMVGQLANDIAALHSDAIGKTDIELGRPTLPLTYAALKGSTLSSLDKAGTQSVLWTDGAVHLTWAVAETYRRQALDLLRGLTSDQSARAVLAGLLPVL